MFLAQALVIDGGSYLITPAAWGDLPSYVPVGNMEARLVVREWVRRKGVSRMTELCRELGMWRSDALPDVSNQLAEMLVARFDDYLPDLALHRRSRVDIALDFSQLDEEVVDLAELSGELASEPDTHWVQLVVCDADRNPLADVDCRIVRPDGFVHDGHTDIGGNLYIGDISTPGECQVSFPGLEEYVRRHLEVA